MEAATVVGLVTALVETFADGQADYEAWQQRRLASNHYRGKGFTRPPCALSTTLAIAGPQILDTYEKALSIIGAEFATGDFSCRSMLWSQLNVLSDRVASLHRAACSTTWAIVDLADATQVCEDVRRASLHALAEQYQRIVAGRPIPKALGVARPRLQPRRTSARSEETLHPVASSKQASPKLTPPSYQFQQHQMLRGGQHPGRQSISQLQQHHLHHSRHQQPSPPTDSDEKTSPTTGGPYNTAPSGFQDEPPSPPLTPKTSATSPDGSLSHPSGPATAQFCAGAAALQADTKEPMPGEGRCACGYEWQGPPPAARDAVPLKEGFRLTARYLAKSHVGREGFGCVLCAPTGRGGRFAGVKDLREHVDACHTKWQLLHDQDCRASSKLADGFWSDGGPGVETGTKRACIVRISDSDGDGVGF